MAGEVRWLVHCAGMSGVITDMADSGHLMSSLKVAAIREENLFRKRLRSPVGRPRLSPRVGRVQTEKLGGEHEVNGSSQILSDRGHAASRDPHRNPGINPRAIVTGAIIICITAAAWWWVLQHSASMGAGGSSATAMVPHVVGYLLSWGVMMAAMMLPSAMPMIALYAGLQKHPAGWQGAVAVAMFTLVYVLVWLATGVPVYILNQGIGWAAATNPSFAGLLPYGVSAVLLAAGAYQFTTLKHACLSACQGPVQFLMNNMQTGYPGPLRLGVKHALYCLGCCAGLMAVLVAAGAMAPHWVVLITGVVFLEKLLAGQRWVIPAVGATFLALGIVVAVQPELAFVLRANPA